MFRQSEFMTYFLVILATLIPRFLLIGAPPATDEGIYAFNALIAHSYMSGQSYLPDVGSLTLYSTLLSWVFSSEVNHFISLRLLDGIFSSITGLMLFLVLEQESQNKRFALILTLIVILTYNDPVFVQYGLKNSIHAALLPLLAAIFLAKKPSSSCLKWQYVGALTALAALLREPFIIFAMLGSVVVLLHSGRRALFLYMLGSVVLSCITLATIIFLRGGYWELLKSYFFMGGMYKAIAYQQASLWKASFLTFLYNCQGLMLMATISIASLFMSMRIQSGILKPAMFWILVTIAPLLEPMLKNAYPYHYAVSFIGLSGLIAYGYRHFQCSSVATVRVWSVAIVISVILLLPKCIKLLQIATQYPVIELLSQKHLLWSDKTAAQSNYLLIAQLVRHHTRHISPTMSINGSMLGLFPLVQALPSHYSLSHLSYALLAGRDKGVNLRVHIYECPPEFIVLTSSSPFRDGSTLNRIIKSIPEYSQIAYIPKSSARHYGSFDGLIYQWKHPLKKCQLTSNG